MKFAKQHMEKIQIQFLKAFLKKSWQKLLGDLLKKILFEFNKFLKDFMNEFLTDSRCNSWEKKTTVKDIRTSLGESLRRNYLRIPEIKFCKSFEEKNPREFLENNVKHNFKMEDIMKIPGGTREKILKASLQ